MGISKEEAIKELQTREMVYVAYSQATKLPYVKCDEESYNDQAWIFSTEEQIKEYLSGNLCRCSGFVSQTRGILKFLQYKKAQEEA